MFYLLFLFACISSIYGKDRTTEKQAWGTDVIWAVLRRIEDTCIFPQDFMFMRRVAWHESCDGSALTSKWDQLAGQGGIWQNDNISLIDMQTRSTQKLERKKAEILENLSVNIDTLHRNNGDLEVPINSGSLARLLVSSFPSEIPVDITAQAEYWHTNYNKNSKLNYHAFLDNCTKEDTKKGCCMLNMPKCESSIDLMFILDSSGSIGSGTFENVRNFVINVVSNLTLSEERNRVGVIEFSDEAKLIIPFSSSSGDIVNAVNNMKYMGSSTETNLALNNATLAFSKDGRALSGGYPRVAVLITDGQPDDQATALAAATNLKSQGITLFVVGVGSSLSPENLQPIASKPFCVHYYSLNNYTTLADGFPTILASRNCETAALAPSNGSDIKSSVGKGQSRIIKFPVNITTGMTYKLSMQAGSAAIYASIHSRTPSSADYDYSATATTNKMGQFFVSPSDLSKVLNSSATLERLTKMTDYEAMDSMNETIFVFAAIEGIDDTNNFTLKYDGGDTVEGGASRNSFVINALLLVALFLFVY